MYSLFLKSLRWTIQYAPANDETSQVRTALGFFSSLLGVFFSWSLGVFLYLNHETQAGWVFWIQGLFFVVVIFSFIRQLISFNTFGMLSFVGVLVGNTIATILSGGMHGSGAMVVWSLLPAILSPILLGTNQTVYWTLTFMLSMALTLFLPDVLGQTSQISIENEKWLFMFNVGGISMFVLLVIQLFVSQRDQYQERSDMLLLNILPREIADVLRHENRIIADAFDSASVLFADVVNFTPLSASMTPVELVNLLNEVFSHFDTITDKYKLEKIKTIGDCYMVASGIPSHRADHAQAVTRMALDIINYVQTHDFNGQKLAFRVGINSGPVVAGVIGQKKFAYDLWGDAVNTASRMESHGASNVIQVTASTYELIKDDFVCEPQPPIFIKGKGEMPTWYVTGEKRK